MVLKPKILMIDMPRECTSELLSKGWNVSEGTFGHLYRASAPTSRIVGVDPLHKIYDLCKLPNHTEQEIVFIDLTKPNIEIVSSEDKSKDQPGAKCAIKDISVVDPRPYAMYRHRKDFDRILKAGGIFIIFAQPRVLQQLSIDGGASLTCDNWSFLSCLRESHLNVSADNGTEIFVEEQNCLTSMLKRHIAGASFFAKCKFIESPMVEDLKLLRNKFDECVGMQISPEKEGTVIILPQIANRSTFVTDLISNCLPQINEKLFPEFGTSNWLHESVYEHPTIIELQNDLEEQKAAFQKQIEDVQSKITLERNANQVLHDLLTKHDKELVTAVRSAFEKLGFEDVLIVDDTESGNNQEDLQIPIKDGFFVCEVKGLGGLPSENHVNQVVKYINRRLREARDANVRGLVVVNHQRNLPPLMRDNCFTATQVTDAESAQVILMSTWELFLLLRAREKYNWPSWAVMGMFDSVGRLPEVPNHYEYIGVVSYVAPKMEVVGFELANSSLNKNDIVAIKCSTGFAEGVIESIEIDQNSVESATRGALVSIKTNLKIKKDARLFKVIA